MQINCTAIQQQECKIIDFPSKPNLHIAKTSTNKPKLKFKARHTTDPIRNQEDIEKMKQCLLGHDLRYKDKPSNVRNYLLFVLGINCARRISDLVSFKVSSVIDEAGNVRQFVFMNEQKTNKWAKIFINDAMKEAILLYLDTLHTYQYDDWLFVSRDRDPDGNRKHITEVRAWQILKEAAKKAGIQGNIGTHSMRKSWVYRVLKTNSNNPAVWGMVSDYLNHRDIKTTYRYAGFSADQLAKLCSQTQL